MLVINIYIGIHGYVFYNSIKLLLKNGKPLLVSRLRGWIYWAVFLAISALYAFVSFERGLRSLFGLANAYWGIILFFPLLLVLDVGFFSRFLYRFVRRLISRIKKEPTAPRIRMPLFTFVSHAIIILIVTCYAVLGIWNARNPVVTEYHLKTEKLLPDGLVDGKLEIIMVSDIHIGALVKGERLSRMVDKINLLGGDMVLIAGDLLDRGLELWEPENLHKSFSHLKAPMGVWAVPGNHDYFSGQLLEFRDKLADCGVSMLLCEFADLNGIRIIGRSDFTVSRYGQKRKPLSELTESADRNRLLIVMDHQPLNLGEAERAGIDLQVSGHTHHGQIWPASIITGRMFENDYGLLYKGNSAFIVSSGYGTWGPSLRVGTKSEIVRIVLTN